MENQQNVNSNSSGLLSYSILGIIGFATFLYLFCTKSNPKSGENKKTVEIGNNNVSDVPQRWVQVGKLSKLIIYPIKSCPGVVVDSAVITRLGLKCKIVFGHRFT